MQHDELHLANLMLLRPEREEEKLPSTVVLDLHLFFVEIVLIIVLLLITIAK